MVNALLTETKGSKHVLGKIVFSLILVLTQTQTPQAMATFTQIPVNTSAVEGTNAVFNCTADGAASVTYLVNNKTIAEVASIGVSLSTPVYSGSQTTLYLYVQVTRDMNNWPVVCIAYLVDGTRDDSSPPAYLHVQALPSAPQHLTANGTEATYVVLTWSQPKDTGLGGDLAYKVFYQDINGASYNMTTTITYHNVTGLSPNTTYTMTVMADNGIAGNEDNRRKSVNVTTKATSDTITTVTPHTDTTHTSPEVVASVVASVVPSVVVVGIVVVIVVILVCRKKKVRKSFKIPEAIPANGTKDDQPDQIEVAIPANGTKDDQPDQIEVVVVVTSPQKAIRPVAKARDVPQIDDVGCAQHDSTLRAFSYYDNKVEIEMPG